MKNVVDIKNFRQQPSDILVVDDEGDIRELVAEILRDAGFETRQANDSDTALQALAERVPSVLVLDIWLRGSELDGLGILEIVSERYPWLPVIMISGHGNIETAVSSIKMGAYAYIEKPFKEEDLLLKVNQAIDAARLKLENMELRQKAMVETELLGNSSLMVQLKQAAEKVSPTNSRILISGPSGSGKEVVARYIHQKSKRGGGSFAVVNSAGVPADKLEVELFGLEDTTMPAGGAKKPGLIERAHMGTLFIDEVADLPLQTQGKMLRLLQEGIFTRVGGTRSVKVDVRVIAATTKELTHEIALGNFREDLYYRLNVVPIKVPALKERREDLPSLSRYFMKRLSEMNGLPIKELGEDAIASLQTYDWPGNVRQLRNLMEWLLIMAPAENGGTIRADMLPPEFINATPAILRADINMDIMSMPLREAREMFEREYLLAQVGRFGGNISKTSAFIGMERSALHRKLKSLGIGGHDEKEKAA